MRKRREGGKSMYCSKCGAKLDEDAKFCSVCGNKVHIHIDRPNNRQDGTEPLGKVELDKTEERDLLDWEDESLKVPEEKDSSSNGSQWIIGITVSFLLLAVAAFIISALIKVNSNDIESDIRVSSQRTVGQHMKENENAEITYGPSEEGAYGTVTPAPTTVFIPTPTPKPTITPVPTKTSGPNKSFKGASSVNALSETAESSDGDYIFKDSDSVYLTEAQLENLTKEQLLYARNEIYARHGRKFNDSSIQAYFDSKSWYTPSYEAAEFDKIANSVFNDYEKKNIELIVKVEESKGYFY